MQPAANQSPQARLEQARMLVNRLERLSADSAWAHRSSGFRGALLRTVERLEAAAAAGELGQVTPADWQHLDFLVRRGFRLLEAAARELGDGK